NRRRPGGLPDAAAAQRERGNSANRSAAPRYRRARTSGRRSDRARSQPDRSPGTELLKAASANRARTAAGAAVIGGAEQGSEEIYRRSSAQLTVIVAPAPPRRPNFDRLHG